MRKAAAAASSLPARTGTRKKTARTAKPKGLEAQYSGRIFRSRLEARWAILLDLLDINWDFEPSHYQVGPALWYLPDFYLPEHELWLEVKGPVFMDAQSMAKCIASVAGPMPLPIREAPYTQAERLLIGGPIRLRQGMTARHTLVTRDASGKAALSYAAVDRRGVTALGSPWEKMEANGVAKARRPAPEKLQMLVDPDPAFGVRDSEAERAYRIAAGIVFDDKTKALSGATDPAILRELAKRRGGRPLGPFPASQLGR